MRAFLSASASIWGSVCVRLLPHARTRLSVPMPVPFAPALCVPPAQGTTILGCYTDIGTRFLHYLTKGMGAASAEYIQGSLQTATNSAKGHGHEWSATRVPIRLRRHGGWALCKGIEVGSIKLPFFLADGGWHSTCLPARQHRGVLFTAGFVCHGVCLPRVCLTSSLCTCAVCGARTRKTTRRTPCTKMRALCSRRAWRATQHCYVPTSQAVC